SHAGGLPGWGAFVAIVPERGFGVVALVNVGHVPAGVALRAADAFLDLPPGPPALAPAPPSTWDRYVGRYHDATGALGHVTVARDGDQLVMTLEDGGALSPELEVTFFAGPDGRIAYLVTPAGVAVRE